jgi:hypothetical protein
MPTFEAVVFDREEQYLHDFLLLPKRLYDPRTCTQNEREEEQILRGSHVLSKYFDVKGILVYQGPDVAARCLVTFYPDDGTAYIGFFECIQDAACAEVLFRAAKDIAKSGMRNRIVGPVNASFWIGYRLKTNGFGKPPYSGNRIILPIIRTCSPRPAISEQTITPPTAFAGRRFSLHGTERVPYVIANSLRKVIPSYRQTRKRSMPLCVRSIV